MAITGKEITAHCPAGGVVSDVLRIRDGELAGGQMKSLQAGQEPGMLSCGLPLTLRQHTGRQKSGVQAVWNYKICVIAEA